MNFIYKAKEYAQKIAIVSGGNEYSYQTLFDEATLFAKILLGDASDLNQQRVAFMVDPGFDYVKVQWAIWLAGGVAVPLCLSHPIPSLQYVIEDTDARVVVSSENYTSFLAPLTSGSGVRYFNINEAYSNIEKGLPQVGPNRDAMILYTSGTTNKPKGVVTTHVTIDTQVESLISAWSWSSSDYILCVLPLHHVHGIINVVCCSMATGATCEFVNSFSAPAIYAMFREGKMNVFMAVPTIYYKLITHWESLLPDEQSSIFTALQKFRLMVCGSAALPISVMQKWEIISGHLLLERYGMTEIGMAISNPYVGERRPGFVGIPLPGVDVRLVDENYNDVEIGAPGEIVVKGKTVFDRYWQRPEATADTFTSDNWFKTGDVAIIENGYYRILGRNSVDIIKSGGYKISSLEIEEVLRTHNAISDCAVVGIEDIEWGELIVACLVLNESMSAAAFDANLLDAWMKENIAPYKRPRKYLVVQELPRNAMGKVVKSEVKKLFL
jgi:malonyl-CoA/methylmalonyl-CoA synthetase